jgi:gliding motility-associated-like protein
MYFNLFVTSFQYNIVVDARQCSLVFNPPIPKWDVSDFRIETTPSIDKYYYDLGEEFNFKASISIPKDSIKSFGWTTEISTTKVDSCKQCLNYKSLPKSTDDTAFIFYAIDVHNCERRERMRIYPKPPPEIPILPPEYKVFLPNAFSPNDDGYNDQLTIYGAEGVEKVIWMRVYDLWGNLVFEQKDFPAGDNHYGWNGTYKGIAANLGTYTCTYRVLLKDGTERTINNGVSLLR